MIVIETQRSYSRLRPSFRKLNIRIAIGLGSWGIALLGVAIFSHAAIAAGATVLATDVLPVLRRSSNVLTQSVTLLAFLIALSVAVVRTFRKLNVKELVCNLPRNGLKQLLVHKKPKATSFVLFAYMELSALLVCLVYASSVAEVAKIFLQLFCSL